MKVAFLAIATGSILFAGTFRAEAASISLYDSSLGGTPNTQGWLRLSSTGGTQTVTEGQTNLDTSASNSYFAGYSNYQVDFLETPSAIKPTSFVNPLFPTLDRTLGYTVSFTVQVLSQFNESQNRSGFSVIALSSDRKGIEICFRQTDIFAQNPSFTIGERNNSATIMNLLTAMTTYNLDVVGDTYTLKAGTTTVLNGSLRDYSNATGLVSDLYKTSNFLFFGDRTHLARANINIKLLSLATGETFSPTIQSVLQQKQIPEPQSVPEPGAIAGLAIVGGCLIGGRRRPQTSRSSDSTTDVV